MANTDISNVGQLRRLALRNYSYSGGIVAELASAVTDALEDVESTKADKASFSTATLSSSGWTTHTDTDYKSAGYTYRYALALSSATAADSADCNLTPDSLSAASECGMCPDVYVADGYVYFYAAAVPSSTISVQVRLIPGTSKGG
jgi:hypothetical protein